MDKLSIKTAVVNGSLGTVGAALVKCLVHHGAKTYAVIYPGSNY